jgi:tRNA-dihydrouridine synthase C
MLEKLPTETGSPAVSPWIHPGVPALVLAPMEGVTDAPMREFWGQLGGFTHLVTEFFRISQDVPGLKTYIEHAPELARSPRGRVTSGLPVSFQLLGGDPAKLALAASRAVEAGALAIDLNFGCPAPTVNRNDGGATLLKYPHRIEAIVRAVRDAVPAGVPVSAKLRLGFDDPNAVFENAMRAVQGGASWITIHGRTKVQGYTPPAYWRPIGEVQKLLKPLGVPVVANGEIFTLEDFYACREQTQCEHFMLGRGALANPLLPFQVAHALGIQNGEGRGFGASGQMGPAVWSQLMDEFIQMGRPFIQHRFYLVKRVKQWLRYAWLRGNAPWFEEVKRMETEIEIAQWLRDRANAI